MTNNGSYLLAEDIWADMLLSRDGQDCEVVVELVHSMPKQGVVSSFKFGVVYGQALSLAQRFRAPWHLVTPKVWKKEMGLSSDKNESLAMARELWPEAPLSRKKDVDRAEALLLAEYWRRCLFES
jgi:crossover junction endodeoxyribonuclease RuvC